MYHLILCRYNEIATKGNNRSMFENQLMENIRRQCPGDPEIQLKRIRGRIFLRKKDGSPFQDSEIASLTDSLSRVFGLESFSPALECRADMEELKHLLDISFPEVFEKRSAGKTCPEFRIRAKRSDKSFPLHSKEIEIELATRVRELLGERAAKLNLTRADVTAGVEIRESGALLYYETFKGPGGLPVGSNSSVLALLSGGIDSPVACNMLMRRGCHVDFLTFHSYPYTPMESVEKVKRIASLVNRYQGGKAVLYICNISELQKLIRDFCLPKYRTVLYRRMMMRIASMLCESQKLSAIVTGEAVGQVASQTIENLSVIDCASSRLILRPLCGMDKLESIHRAETIGTFETSIEPVADSCTVFAPASPVLHATLEHVEEEESKIPEMTEQIHKTFQSIESWICHE